MYVDKTNKILDNNESVKICVWKRKTTENTQRECVRGRDKERAERNFKIILRLCTFNALISAIYTSPHGTDGSTMYFNAHTSI